MPVRSVAIFDFDHTLITSDSFFPFLCFATGHLRVYGILTAALWALVMLRLRGDRVTETRFFVKDYMIRHLLTGKSVAQLMPAAVRLRQWQTVNTPIMKALREHRANGDVIVIASGGLDLYLPQMLRDVPHDALICTDIGVAGGVVTGEMIKGNCVRLRKAERVAAWLAENGPFDQSWGYGNYPHDVPMMNLVKHRIIVS